MPLRKPQQGARALGKLEADQRLVRDPRGVAADHVADVQLGRLVVGHVDDGKRLSASRAISSRRSSSPRPSSTPTKTWACPGPHSGS